MFCKRNGGWVGGTLLLGSTLLSLAQATPQAQSSTAQVEAFVAPNPAQVNLKATPALDTTIDLVFPLVFKKRAQLDALIKAQQDPNSPLYQHFLTPTQIGQQFGADPADLRAIVHYAQVQGFTVTNVWPNHLFVSATANVAQVEKAFHIQLLGYDRPKEMLQPGDPTTFFAPDRKPTLPANIASRITGVLGLSNFLIARPALRPRHLLGKWTAPSAPNTPASPQEAGIRPHPMTNFSGPLSPAQVSTLYNLDGLHTLGLNGQGMNIAIASPTQFQPSDVQTFATNYNITGWTLNEKWVAADGRAIYNDYGGASEASLDCEMIIGQANQATLNLYETNWDTDAHLIDAWNQIAADAFPVVSCSWSNDESYLTSDKTLVTSWDTALALMVAAGQSVFVASGDTGAEDDAGHFGIGLPSSDPNVTAVGGTQNPADTARGTWASEQGWGDGTYGSGGGLSIFYAQPTWQIGPGVKNSYSNGMRQIPDVAALAGNPGYNIYAQIDGGWGGASGTSASTPLWATATLLMDESTGYATKGIGNLAPLLYKLNATSINPAFHDITVGSNATSITNGKYPCTVGWDFVTGWGSADFTKLYAALYPPARLTLASLTLNPSSIIGIGTVTGTVALSEGAPTGGVSVALSSDNPAATVKSPLTIAAGQTSATFTIPVTAVTSNTTATIKATVNGSSKSVLLTIQKPPVTLSSITLNPTAVIGGSTSTATIVFSNAVPTGGVTVTLSSNNSLATVPTSLSVPAGQSSATFTINTATAASITTATITATLYGSSQAATLTINKTPILQFLGLNPLIVVGGSTSTGTVILSAPAPAGGITLTPTYTNVSNSIASVTKVTIPAGKTSGTFTINTHHVLSTAVDKISVTYGTITLSASLTIIF